jgi:hypothetical protein
MTEEIDNSINFLDMTINRNTYRMIISIYRKPTSTNIRIQHTSNHPQEHKEAAYRYYINRMITLPNTEEAKLQERKYILNTARHNGFPKHKIIDIERKEKAKNEGRVHNKRYTRKTSTEKMDNIHIS